jgi:hypothetical protein
MGRPKLETVQLEMLSFSDQSERHRSRLVRAAAVRLEDILTSYGSTLRGSRGDRRSKAARRRVICSSTEPASRSTGRGSRGPRRSMSAKALAIWSLTGLDAGSNRFRVQPVAAARVRVLSSVAWLNACVQPARTRGVVLAEP